MSTDDIQKETDLSAITSLALYKHYKQYKHLSMITSVAAYF